MRLLEKEPEKRFQTAADLQKVLREIAEGFLREAYGPSGKAVVVPAPRPVALREIQLIDRLMRWLSDCKRQRKKPSKEHRTILPRQPTI
jgi:hypothetical protein